MKVLTLEEIRKMSKTKIQIEIGKRVMFLQEELGMSKEDSRVFVASIMNLAIVMEEKHNNE